MKDILRIGPRTQPITDPDQQDKGLFSFGKSVLTLILHNGETRCYRSIDDIHPTGVRSLNDIQVYGGEEG